VLSPDRSDTPAAVLSIPIIFDYPLNRDNDDNDDDDEVHFHLGFSTTTTTACLPNLLLLLTFPKTKESTNTRAHTYINGYTYDHTIHTKQFRGVERERAEGSVVCITVTVGTIYGLWVSYGTRETLLMKHSFPKLPLMLSP
jgi:hypothetical protein